VREWERWFNVRPAIEIFGRVTFELGEPPMRVSSSPEVRDCVTESLGLGMGDSNPEES
jgi:hypothetical protein